MSGRQKGHDPSVGIPWSRLIYVVIVLVVVSLAVSAITGHSLLESALLDLAVLTAAVALLVAVGMHRTVRAEPAKAQTSRRLAGEPPEAGTPWNPSPFPSGLATLLGGLAPFAR